MCNHNMTAGSGVATPEEIAGQATRHCKLPSPQKPIHRYHPWAPLVTQQAAIGVIYAVDAAVDAQMLDRCIGGGSRHV